MKKSDTKEKNKKNAKNLKVVNKEKIVKKDNENTKIKTKKSLKARLLEDKVLTILIILLIGLTLFLIISNIVRGRNLNTESKLVTELHDYFSTDDLNNCNGLFTYSDKTMNYDSISSDNRLCLAYHKSNLKDVKTETLKRVDKKSEVCKNDYDMTFRITEDTDECQVSIIDKDVIDSTYKKIFGKDIENNQEFRADDTHICYLKDDKYYCGLSEQFTYTYGREATIYRVLNEAIKKGSEIYLYDYFVKTIDNNCYQNYTTQAINEECTNNYEEDKMNFEFMEKYATQYKHTFKKAKDGTYYWVSTELVK